MHFLKVLSAALSGKSVKTVAKRVLCTHNVLFPAFNCARPVLSETAFSELDLEGMVCVCV